MKPCGGRGGPGLTPPPAAPAPLKCKCNGHAQSCSFDWLVWRESGQRSGGVCECLHNTEGHNCQSCKTGFYRDPQRPHTAQDFCKPCGCHPLGSIPFHPGGRSPCDPTNGDCVCKPGVGGSHCDRCMVGYWGFHDYGCRPCDCAGDCDPFTGYCMSGSDLDLYNLEGNSSEPVRIFRADELFSALHYSEKCECKEQVLANSKLFCSMKFAYESWTARGCTCPILNPGQSHTHTYAHPCVEYLVAGHADRKQNRLIVNMKSFVKPWRASLGRKVLTLMKENCTW
ncbi:unnamed protein product [Coregonus sp. 'balchen']|nr:unnamed protein product [Coregonus sp. 'balchen']